jgi:hypothetical protein
MMGVSVEEGEGGRTSDARILSPSARCCQSIRWNSNPSSFFFSSSVPFCQSVTSFSNTPYTETHTTRKRSIHTLKFPKSGNSPPAASNPSQILAISPSFSPVSLGSERGSCVHSRWLLYPAWQRRICSPISLANWPTKSQFELMKCGSSERKVTYVVPHFL